MISPNDGSAMNGEDMESGIEPMHMRVRQALNTLPKATCPVGFEFRLERRLAGKPVGGKNFGWSMSWLGAGLGFGAAMVLALFMFDFGGAPGTSPNNISGTSAIKSSGVQIEQKAVATEQEKTPEQLAATPDSMKDKTKPGTLPEGKYETVGGTTGR